MKKVLAVVISVLCIAAIFPACSNKETVKDSDKGINATEVLDKGKNNTADETKNSEPEVTPKATPQIAACEFPDEYTDFEEFKQYIRNQKSSFRKDIEYIPVLDCSDGKLQFAFATCNKSYIHVYYSSPGIDVDKYVCVTTALYDTIDDGGYMSYMHKRYGTEKIENDKRTVYYGGIDYELPGGGWGKEETMFWQENGLDTEIHTPYYVYSELGYTTEDIVNLISFDKL